MPRRPRVLGVVLAGGQGSRLWPLTRDRAKPAVPFAGDYRLIDFALSNLVNGGYVRIAVLTQYKSHSLDMHLAKAWRLSATLGNYVAPVPAQQREGKRWFEGSADALYQNLNLVHDERPDYICVFGADHIYKMDPSQMVDAHIEAGRDVTVAGIRVPRPQAFRFGVIEPGADDRIAAFHEKPSDARGLPDDPDQVFASMGNYVFTAQALVDAVIEDHEASGSEHDMGGNIITQMVTAGGATVYDFNANDVPGSTGRDQAYWRDVGTLESYYDAHADLISADPVFNLYNRDWPIHTWHASLPPAKFVHDQDGRRGNAVNSMVSNGAIVSGGVVRNSVISPRGLVHSYALVEDSILLHNVEVGRGAVIKRAIIDKDVVVPENARIGVDPDFDQQHFHVSDTGIVVIGKGDEVPLP